MSQTETQTDAQTGVQKETQTDAQTNSQTNTQTNTQTDAQTGTQTGTQTGAQTDTEADAQPIPRPIPRKIDFPGDTGYTFVDEMWRTHTVHPQRYVARRVGKGPLRLTMPIGHAWDRGMYRTADFAAKADMELWLISRSVDDYEARKRGRNERLRREAEAKKGKGTFHRFKHLPPELRLMVWEMAMQEPTKANVYETKHLYTTRAPLPPLMLATRESNTVASKHCRRVLRNIFNGGGILASPPVDLHMDDRVFFLMQYADFDIVRDIVVDVGDYGVVGQIARVILDKLDIVIRAPYFRSLELRYGSGKTKPPSRFESFLPIVLASIQTHNRLEINDMYTKVTRNPPMLKEGVMKPL
ncbi:hypothetical protein GGR51DRAFT_515687 [Nemania sp. FL0031]|nr:hypothetical protein GGR51DRAFT_515687 [Nemania sp. FL0031]